MGMATHWTGLTPLPDHQGIQTWTPPKGEEEYIKPVSKMAAKCVIYTVQVQQTALIHPEVDFDALRFSTCVLCLCLFHTREVDLGDVFNPYGTVVRRNKDHHDTGGGATTSHTSSPLVRGSPENCRRHQRKSRHCCD